MPLFIYFGKSTPVNRRMDQKKLEQFVGTYAEYIYHTDPGSDHRKDPCSDNPKASLVIVKLKAWPTDCEDCGKHCTGKIDKSLVWDFAKERWNQRCLSCKRAFNHATGAWEYAAKKSNIRPKDPVTGMFLKEQLADESPAHSEQQPNDVNQG